VVAFGHDDAGGAISASTFAGPCLAGARGGHGAGMLDTSMTSTELLVWGFVVHLVVDWLFQNIWMARHKTEPSHPAGYVHAGLHGAALLLVFPWPAAAALGVAHFVIDTRWPLRWWGRIVSRPTDGPIAIDVHLWRDQALHVAVIAAAALVCAG
jgi:hypothetical protein